MNFSISKVVSWIISILFHPLIMASVGALILLFWYPEYRFLHINEKSSFFTMFFVFTYVLPLVAIPLYYIVVKFMKVEVSEHHVRLFLLLTTTGIYVFTYNILMDYLMFPIVNIYLLLSSVLMLLSLVITYFWKISLHMIGVGGLLGLVASMFYALGIYDKSLLALIVLVVGGVAYARLQLQAHTQYQIYAGLGLGFFVSFLYLNLVFISS